MSYKPNFEPIRSYFSERLTVHGATPRGADWNSDQSQNTRFDQLLKVVGKKSGFTILDYGCGYGAFADYMLSIGFEFERYYGFDILDSMVVKGRELHPNDDRFVFTSDLAEIPQVDYTIASGVFNVRLETDYESWTDYTVECLAQMDKLSRGGFSSNFLTKYSDADRMQPQLYYADPCYLFDYCKRHFSKNVALLHDYTLYDFTILVRKDDLH